MIEKGNKWDQNQTFSNVLTLGDLGLCSSILSLRGLNFGMTSDPSLATLLSNALTCPRPTTHASFHHDLEARWLWCILFWGRGVACLIEPKPVDWSKQLKMSNQESDGAEGSVPSVIGLSVRVCQTNVLFLDVWTSRQGHKRVQSTRGRTRDLCAMFHPFTCGGGWLWSVALGVSPPSSSQPSVTVKRCFTHFISC